MNRSGFTTLEVIIASALILTLVTTTTLGVRQVGLLNQFAATRTSHTELRTRIAEALADSGTCADNLGGSTPGLIPTFSGGNPIAIPFVRQIFMGASSDVVTNNQLLDGIRYTLRMTFPAQTPGSPFGTIFKAGFGRATQTTRYDARLEVVGFRESLAQQGGAATSIRAEIPISVEFDNLANRIASCSTNAEDMEEQLAGGTHSVRECMAADGTPMMTPIGLVCRIPVRKVNPSAAPTIPSCASIAGGTWTDAAPAPNYNSTVARDTSLPGCGGPVHFATGWHYFSRTGIESQTRSVKKGYAKFLGLYAGGGTFMGSVLTGFVMTALLNIVGIILFITMTKCKSESATYYSQVNGIGCV